MVVIRLITKSLIWAWFTVDHLDATLKSDLPRVGEEQLALSLHYQNSTRKVNHPETPLTENTPFISPRTVIEPTHLPRILPPQLLHRSLPHLPHHPPHPLHLSLPNLELGPTPLDLRDQPLKVRPNAVFLAAETGFAEGGSAGRGRWP